MILCKECRELNKDNEPYHFFVPCKKCTEMHNKDVKRLEAEYQITK